MRITVGGVLVVLAGATLGYWASGPQGVAVVGEKGRSFGSEISSLFGLFKSGGSEKTVELTPAATPSSDNVVSPSTVALTTEVLTPPLEVPTPLTQAIPADELQETPVPKSRRKNFRRYSVKNRSSKTPVVPKTSKRVSSRKAAPTKADGLVGTYVSLELTTGRTVMGILEEKTTKGYRLQLPGLGPFVYPFENVKSIKPAQ